MSKKKLITLITAILIAAIVIVIIVMNSGSKFTYNEDNVVGNSPGNLYNGGLFCEFNDVIYFANPEDDYQLYSMTRACRDIKKLNSDKVGSINVAGDYIYYAKNNFDSSSNNALFIGFLYGIYRANLDGSSPTSLYDELSGTISLCGNYIYYQYFDGNRSMYLHKIKIDGKENKRVALQNYNPSCCYNGKFYFTNTDSDRNVLCLDTATDSVSTYFYGNTYMPTHVGNYMYYIDLNDGYALKRCNTNTKLSEVIVDTKCINYNIIGNRLFYVTEDDQPGLYRCNLKGQDVEQITKGSISHVHCTSVYTFFSYHNDPTVYKVPSVGRFEEITRLIP